ncbi:Dolichyl-phosphate-mannose-protein mannosyltransferase [Mariniphaga anaerophila]|uniref:Dolichyl-phosphate-mannose-protein mannosyltransferase n=1 Tax=Mariniphaga anaerophila TaxID=1484053 RepID=A0A1M5ABK0_9BACT|nr:glycosyltransferase family 39 protein [Mariniphaga anaerophila]SHF27680.1 Dolichyl-phosphate-mannose-protein mannosyltransferase [Mariniphaga anaerophila]
MNNLTKKHYYLIGAWFVINLLQAIFTGLHSDESYYWMYSENMAWGYFDHPPMVALIIHLGHLLLPGELGVRLVIILLSTATFALILNELNEKKDLFFLGVFVLSFPLLHTHIAGFLAIPDIPLLFFTLWFIILYKKFLKRPSLPTSVLLSVVGAAMIYSKYHAFLVIGLTVLSNLKLLRNKYFWVTVALTIVLLIPHAWWQIENEFPTFKYHLVERAKPFRLKHVTDYLLNQLVMAGPLTGILIFWKLTKFKIKNDFDRALIFNIVGFYAVFFLLSFKNRIEAHWTAAIMPMLMFATYPLIKNDAKVKKWFTRLAVPIIALLLLFRIYLALDVIPNVGHTKITFYNREAHALEIKELAQGKKVGFFDNYAAASNYIFYTGDSAVHLSTPNYRFNQYDLWDEEKYAEGETVLAIQSKHLNPPHLQRMATGQMRGYIIIEKFQSLKGLQIEVQKAEDAGNNFQFEIKLSNTNARPIFAEHVSEPVLAAMQDRAELVSLPLYSALNQQKLEPGEKATVSILVPKEKLDIQHPVTFYTRSKENIRGEIISYKIK